MATASLSVEEVIEDIYKNSGEENVSESEREDQRERVLFDPSFDAIVFLKTKPIYLRQLLIGESLILLAAIRRRLILVEDVVFDSLLPARFTGTCHWKYSVF